MEKINAAIYQDAEKDRLVVADKIAPQINKKHLSDFNYCSGHLVSVGEDRLFRSFPFLLVAFSRHRLLIYKKV